MSERKHHLEDRRRPITYREFSGLALAKGVRVIDLCDGRWRVLGKLVVDYHPFHRRGPWAGVRGARSRWIRRSPERAIALACGSEWLPLIRFKRRPKRLSTHERRSHLRKSYLRAGGICCICGEHVPPDEASLEHLVPLSRGGLNVPENFGMSHKRCNSKRGNQPL